MSHGRQDRASDHGPIASKRFLSPLGGAFAWRGEVMLLARASPGSDEIAQHLRSAGFAVRACRPEEMTLRRFLLRPPVLLVIDLAHASDPSLELVRKVREALGSLAPAAIAIVEGEDETIFGRAFGSGCADVLARPVPASVLRVKSVLHARPESDLPSSIGGYRILRLLGRGGTGTVYLAERRGREVALKVLDAGVATEKPETLARFKREANALRTLRGKGIPRFHDAGRVDDCFFCVMEFVPGEPLSFALDRGPLRESTVALVVDRVAEALETIHAADLVHRDVKPQNVILLPAGGAKLVDFGLAKFRLDPTLTRPDELVGTVHYMAPEVVRGECAAPSSDAFALGMIALESLLGTCPVPGPADAVAARLARGDVPRARTLAPAAPATLAAVIDGLLDPLPACRMGLAEARSALFPLCSSSEPCP